MEYIAAIMILIFLTFLAYWRGNAVVFMLAAGVSMMAGLYSPGALSELSYSRFGVGIGLMLIMYSFVCIALAYGNLLKGD